MNLRVANENALFSAIKRSKNEIALLIGSPLSASCSPNEKGIPSVSGILEIIKDYVSLDSELFNDYTSEVLSKYSNDNEKYQKSFEFLADFTDPNTPNGIIRKAVLQSCKAKVTEDDIYDEGFLYSLQENTDEWHIPPATLALASIIKINPDFKGPVLTTNFDPLLSIALKKIGHNFNRTVLHGDGNLDSLQSNLINIVHMHGFWTSTDTMHTQSQLRLNRPKLKSSLSRVLKNKTLIVLGYSGWDDIFMQALRDVMDDDSANLDVMWAFYESDLVIIQNKYESLISAVQPAIGRNRFRMYGGINCHEFLPNLCSKISEQKEAATEIKNDKVLEQHEEGSVDEIIFRDEGESISPWNIHMEQAHMHIREIEREGVFEILRKDSIVNLVSDWGLSKDEFVGTLVEDTNSPIHQARIYRVDLTGVITKQDLLDKIESDYGTGLHNFIYHMLSGKYLLYLDDFDSGLNREKSKMLWSVINWLSILLVEYNSECKIIVCSKSPISHCAATVRISKLEEFDIRSYITNHSKIQETPDERLIECLTELSRGMPSFLDKYIGDLEFLSVDDIYDLHFSPEANRHDEDSSYPSELRNRIENLRLSQEEHSKRSYELLKVLSVLEFGDSFANIKRSNPKFNFKLSNLKELYSLELVESLSINKSILKTINSIGDDKLHYLPPIVRNYVYNHLDFKEVFQIVQCVADIHLGKNWRSGSLNLCKVTQDLLAESSKLTGSTYLIIIYLLRFSIELNNGRGIVSAIKICEAYCMYLSTRSRHREIVKFIERVKLVIRESDKISTTLHLDIYEGEARRMVKDYDNAILILESAYAEIKSQNNPERSILKRVLSSLSYFYQSSNDWVKANVFAEELLGIDKNNRNALYIAAVASKDKSINELKDLEKEFRNNNGLNNANNLCYVISDRERGYKNKIKWLDRIINGKDDQYNKIRAITRKGLILIENGINLDFSPQELNLLHTSYFYNFSQKISSSFTRTHKVLWEFYSQKKNHIVLFFLFKQSSLFWRVYEDLTQEQFYSLKLLNLIKDQMPDTIDLSKHRYETLRVRILSDK